MEFKNKTSPLFDLPEDEIPPTDELPSAEASLAKRALAFLIDFIILSIFIALPFLILHPETNIYSLLFSLLLYSFIVIFAYHFLFYLFLGRTIGDMIAGIRLYKDKFTLSQAFLFCFVKTIFTIIPMNLIFPFILEQNLTGEQFMFGRVYQED